MHNPWTMSSNLAPRLLSLPANAAFLGHFSRNRQDSRWAQHPSCAPEEVDKPYLTLGTHPDCVVQLWDRLGGKLPTDCRWVAWGTPILVNPVSSLVFAFAGGTVYGLRLSPGDRQQAVASGYQQEHTFSNRVLFKVSDFGAGWFFGKWKTIEEEWISNAYQYAQAVGA
jgi:hypothetical protein